MTFDLWDTIFKDDTDEPKRAAAGQPSKVRARRDLVHDYLARHETISRDRVDVAYDVADAAFRKSWHDQHVTWTVRERLEILLEGLARELPEAELVELTQFHEEMELEYRPDPVPGIHEAVRRLQGHYKLAIVSDAIFSPGRCLRRLLDGEGLLGCFQGFVFSDELGCSKPAPKVFHAAAQQLGCDVTEIVHVGDREQNDVDGPHAVGARAVLATVFKDRGSANSRADAICGDFGALWSLIEGLDGQSPAGEGAS